MLLGTTTSEKYIAHDSLGEESKCKKKFAKMILAAYKYQKTQQHTIQMKLLFDANGNVDMMRVVKKQQNEAISEYHKFCGNSQYLPPELSIQSEYSSELADVWVLGIFLYRMLVGRYPFIALNDKQLFEKMLSSDFIIPPELSSDAADLLCSMLAPNSTRITLDLIIYHPWLLPYRSHLIERLHPLPSSSSSPSLYTPTVSPDTSHFKPLHVQKPTKSRPFKKLFLFIVKGPYPPPIQINRKY